MRKLALAAVTASLTLAALPSAATATATDVCNEAENSWQGDYEMTETSDPRPPAFLRGKQMVLGNGKGKGLVHAAERSPALEVCSGGDDNGGGGDGGGPVTDV